MIEWYVLLPAFGLGLQVGLFIKEREWRKSDEAEFDRRMAVLREQVAKEER